MLKLLRFRGLTGFRHLVGSTSKAIKSMSLYHGYETGDNLVKHNTITKNHYGLPSPLGLERKISGKTYSDQVAGTLQQLATPLQEADKANRFLKEMRGKNSTFIHEVNWLLHDFRAAITCAKYMFMQGKPKNKETEMSYKEWISAYDATLKKQESLIKQLNGSVDQVKACLACLESRLHCLGLEQNSKGDGCISREQNLANTGILKSGFDLWNQSFCLQIPKFGAWKCAAQVKAALAATQYQLSEVRKHYSIMLDGKQIAQSKHLKAPSLSNDQLDNDHKDSSISAYQQELGVKSSPKQYETNTADGRIAKSRKRRNTAETNMVRQLHTTAEKDVKRTRKIPGNTATIVLDRNNLPASKRSYKKGIRRVRSWCRSNGMFKDLSNYLGEGMAVYTTPAKGTFHLTIRCGENEITLFLNGRDLYLMGWQGPFGIFEIQKKKEQEPSKKKKRRGSSRKSKEPENPDERYIRHLCCPILRIGHNYRNICPGNDLGNVKIGPFAMMDSVDSLCKCKGVVSGEHFDAITVLIVNTAEAIRREDVFEEILESFENYHLQRLNSRKDLRFQVRAYRWHSHEILKYVDHLVRGVPPEKIKNRGDENIKSIEELMNKVKIVHRDAYDQGIFGCEARSESPVWYPPYEDAVLEDEDTPAQGQEMDDADEEEEEQSEEVEDEEDKAKNG